MHQYHFGFPQLAVARPVGGIIAASAIASPQLLRRSFRKYPWLAHRLFDPQLYLAGLDPNTAAESVIDLASWPWFGPTQAPRYTSGQHGTLPQWKRTYRNQLLQGWTRQPPMTDVAIHGAVSAAIDVQLELGCEAIIIPGPLTSIAAQNFELETRYLDAAIGIATDNKLKHPLFATIALSDNVLRGINPEENPLLRTISDQIAARQQIAGAYIVIDQANEAGYVCTNAEVLLSVLLLTDDLARGARRKVAVNYLSTFGAATVAAGATIWAAGYYMSQRRLRLSDFDDRTAFAYPRFLSLRLAGDIGLEGDVFMVHRLGHGDRALTQTNASNILRVALAAGRDTAQVPEWQHRQTNISAAAAHYYDVCCTLGTDIYSVSPEQRIDLVHRWLDRAAALAAELEAAGVRRGYYTELTHQRVWLDAFIRWRTHAGV